MELRICCETKIELDDYVKVEEIVGSIGDYTFSNGELNGEVNVTGTYLKKDETTDTFTKKVPFTLMFKNASYNIEVVRTDNFKYYEIVNNGIECSFEIYAQYEMKISEGSIPNIISEEKETVEPIETKLVAEEITENAITDNVITDNAISIDSNISDIDVLDNAPEQVITDIKEKYDELLNNIFLNRDDTVQINNKDDKKLVLTGLKEVKDTVRVYYPKQENEIEKICQSENVSISKIYENDLNKDFQNRKRIIIKK